MVDLMQAVWRVNRPSEEGTSSWDSPRWPQWAACRDTGPAVFFPGGNPKLARAEEERAKALCSSCPVRARCLAFAVEHEEAYGVWGGLNAEERRALPAAPPENGQGAE